MRLGLILLTLLTLATPAEAETLALGAVEDTYINLDATNYSTQPQLNLYTWPVNKIANAILLTWDLSAIPASATIQSAQLQLYLESAAGADATYDTTAHRVINKNPGLSQATGFTYDGTNGWTPNACCNNNVPLAQADIAPAESTTVIDRVVGVKTWTVTQMVQAWVASPATNFGMLVNSDPVAGDGGRTFASREAVDAARRPRLTITYTTGVPPAPPAQLSLSWQDASLNEQGFRVYRRRQIDGAETLLASVGANATTYQDVSVLVSTVYCYRVSAYNAAGESPKSNEACGLPGATLVPGKPALTVQEVTIP